MPHMRVGQMLWFGSNQKLSCPTKYSSPLHESALFWPWVSSSMGNGEGGNLAIWHAPNQMGPTLWSHLNLGFCWWMSSAFDMAHLVSALKYVWARELLWNNNGTYEILALSNEQLESKRMAFVRQGRCWYFCKKHMPTFWRCKLKMQDWKRATTLCP